MKINPTLNPEIFDIFINYAVYFSHYHGDPDCWFPEPPKPSAIKKAAIEFSRLSGKYAKPKALVSYYERVNKVEKSDVVRNKYVYSSKRTF